MLSLRVNRVVEAEREQLQSVADDALIRTHLANERTFLAWLRTAIVLIGAGVAAAALTDTEGFERAVAVGLGTASVVAGFILVAFAYISYKGTVEGIAAGSYRPTNRLPLVAAFLTAAVALGGIIFVAVEWYAD
jgi:putative membrane protein